MKRQARRLPGGNRSAGICSFLLALTLIFSLLPVRTGSGEGKELTVAGCTAMSGSFFPDLFNNTAADRDVQTLIHGYNLILQDYKQGVYALDSSVVRDSMYMDNDAGDRTYYLILQDDLTWNDGTPITAWDYAFTLLLTLSPEMAEIGARVPRTDHILGAADYHQGLSPSLRGVSILSNYQLAVTLNHTCLPCFYELSLLSCQPMPIQVLAPGCSVRDDGEGVYLAPSDPLGTGGALTAELLRQTLLDPETGYLTHPAVTCGPYNLLSWDGTTARFTRNEYYKGTVTGVQPAIGRVAYTVIPNTEIASRLKSGKVQLVTRVAYGEAAEAAGELKLSSATYPRYGLTMVAFSCEMPAVKEIAVRQAIAWCMDRDMIAKDYCGENGERVDGYFGTAQWEYQLATGLISAPTNLIPEDSTETEDTQAPVWSALTLSRLTPYTANTAKANALLDGAGWTLNEKGEAYTAGQDAVRCKQVDGELVSLALRIMVPAGNQVADSFEKNWISNLNRCGIQLTVLETPVEELLASYYRHTARETEMIFLGTSFRVMTDPTVNFSMDTAASQEAWAGWYSADEELYWRAVSMRRTDPEDVFGYMTKWVAFQERFNEVLPMLPVYSGNYRDFWSPRLTGYNLKNHINWASAILYASFQ